MAETRLLRIREVLDRIGLGRSKLYQLVKADPDFPRPVHVGKAVRWRDRDIEEWIGRQGQETAA